MKNFYKNNLKYKEFQKRLRELGHIDLQMDLTDIVGEAIDYGINRLAENLERIRRIHYE